MVDKPDMQMISFDNKKKCEVMAVLVRDCAGGVVFCADKVFLLKNEKGEWVLPKGRIRGDMLPADTALQRVKIEGGIDAEIVIQVGETRYEFFSVTRRQPVFNKINWFAMRALDEAYQVNAELQYADGGYFAVPEAIELATYSQDKGLISVAYRKYQEIMA